jgi:ribonuclease R
MYDFAKNETSSAARGKFTSELKDDCDLSSKNELIAVKCERDVDSMKFAEYMSKHIGESYDVTVTNVSPFGVFVQLDNSIQGLIRIANLGNDFFTFNDKTYELVGKNTGLRLTLGSKLNVELIVADKYQRKIEFKLNKFLSNR